MVGFMRALRQRIAPVLVAALVVVTGGAALGEGVSATNNDTPCYAQVPAFRYSQEVPPTYEYVYVKYFSYTNDRSTATPFSGSYPPQVVDTDYGPWLPDDFVISSGVPATGEIAGGYYWYGFSAKNEVTAGYVQFYVDGGPPSTNEADASYVTSSPGDGWTPFGDPIMVNGDEIPCPPPPGDVGTDCVDGRTVVFNDTGSDLFTADFELFVVAGGSAPMPEGVTTLRLYIEELIGSSEQYYEVTAIEDCDPPPPPPDPEPTASYSGAVDCEGLVDGNGTVDRDGLEGNLSVTVNGQPATVSGDSFVFSDASQPLTVSVTIGETAVPAEGTLVGPAPGSCEEPPPPPPPPPPGEDPEPVASFTGKVDCANLVDVSGSVNRDGLEGNLSVTVNGQPATVSGDSFTYTDAARPLTVSVNIGSVVVPVEGILIFPGEEECAPPPPTTNPPPTTPTTTNPPAGPTPTLPPTAVGETL